MSVSLTYLADFLSHLISLVAVLHVHLVFGLGFMLGIELDDVFVVVYNLVDATLASGIHPIVFCQ